MRLNPQAGAQAQDGAGVLRNIGLVEGYAHVISEPPRDRLVQAANGANVALRTHCGSSRGYTCTLAARVPIKLRRNASRLTFPRSDATGSFRRRTGPTGGGLQRG